MKMSWSTSTIAGPVLSALILGGPVAVVADQQKQAHGYVFWDLGAGESIDRIYQQIWVDTAAESTQWVYQWTWATDTEASGYLGIHTQPQEALFSIWKAVAQECDTSDGGYSYHFNNEGIGWSCRKPLEIKTGTFYRLILLQDEVASDGVWWRAAVLAEAASGTTAYALGRLKVSSEFTSVSRNDFLNFSEYFGDAVPSCGAVPFSVVAVTPPVVNGTQRATFRQFNAAGNQCTTGNETIGALFAGHQACVMFQTRSEDGAFVSQNEMGAFMFLGGDKTTHSVSEVTPPFKTIILFHETCP